jgi:hypothetical protein
MNWVDERRRFQQRFDELSQENIDGVITELNQVLGRYIENGGISQDPNNNPTYSKIIELKNRLNNLKDRYYRLNEDIITFLGGQAKDNNLAGLLTENGELQKQINRLNKITDEIKIDVESAIARDEILRSRDTDISRHNLFLLDRPVRRGMIPYLWAISILFIGIGIIIFNNYIPSFTLSTNVTNQIPFTDLLYNFISNKMVIFSLIGALLLVILFLSLKIAGIFGK